MEFSFVGKKVLVTGAGRGIGRELAKVLDKKGAIVYALSKNADNLKSLKEECKGIRSIVCDLSQWDETEKVLKDLEPVDYLVNNAGVAYRENFFDIQGDTFDKIFSVNVKGLLNVTKLVTKKMVDGGIKGSVVNVSSVSAIKQGKGLLSYCASKAAVDMITKCSAIELAPHNIRVNSVNPTIVMTDMGYDLWSDKQVAESVRQKIPLGKFAEVDHCTNAILFMLSDLSGMTTGEFFLIDGGYTAS